MQEETEIPRHRTTDIVSATDDINSCHSDNTHYLNAVINVRIRIFLELPEKLQQSTNDIRHS